MARISLVTFYDEVCIGIRVIASHLKELGHECQLVFVKRCLNKRIDEPIKNNVNYQQISSGKLFGYAYDTFPLTETEIRLMLEQLESFRPDVVGISTRSFFDDLSLSIFPKIRERLPGALLVAGGFGPTLSYENYLECVDLVIRGDGEDAIAEIVQAIQDGASYKTIENICYKENETVIVNRLRPPEKDLSKYPHPAFKTPDMVLIEDDCAYAIDPYELSNSYFVFVGRGCVGKCSYCSGGQWTSIYNADGYNMPRRRTRSIDDVISELVKAKEAGFTFISISDEFLVAPSHYMRELFQRYRDEIGLPFFAYVHPRVIETFPDIFELMIEAGLKKSVVGIQSGSEKFSRDIYCRNNSNADILWLAGKLNDAGIQIDYHFIGGNVFETDETFDHNLELVRLLPFDIGNDTLTWSLFTAFPKSPIVERFGMAKLKEKNLAKWRYQGMLLYLRAIMEDEAFSTIRHIIDIPSLEKEIFKTKIDCILKGKYTELDTSEEEKAISAVVNCFIGKKVHIWGTGQAYEEKKHLLENCHIEYAFDNNSKMWGTNNKDNIPIVSPETLNKKTKRPMFICSHYKPEITAQIRGMGLQTIIP